MLINNYMTELAKCNFAIEFGEYDSGYICDIISEIADDGISIYTKDQIDYAMNNSEAVSNAFFSGIAPDAREYMKNNNGDFYGYIAAVGAAALYESNIQAIYDNMEECVLFAVCNALKERWCVTELSEYQIDKLWSIEFDNNDMLEDVIKEAAESIGIFDN